MKSTIAHSFDASPSLDGRTVKGSIGGTLRDLEEAFELHRPGAHAHGA